MKKILVAEDEQKIAELVANYLRNEGYHVVTARDGSLALKLFESESPHLVILDISLPEINGLDVCRTIRQKGDTPIIMLTARSDELDKLLGLELGADDYMTKPFSLRELAARVRAVLRRWQRDNEVEKIEFEVFELDLHQRALTICGLPITLTPTEFRMMEMFLRAPGRVFTRSQILEGALDESFDGYERSIDTHIRNLRRKLEREGVAEYITTVFGVGYKLEGQARGKSHE